MSDNIPLTRQRQWADFTCEDEKYILDIFSCALPEIHGRGESRKQVFVYITRAKENNRLPFFQVIFTLYIAPPPHPPVGNPILLPNNDNDNDNEMNDEEKK